MKWIKTIGFILMIAVGTAFATEALGITGEAGGAIGLVVGCIAALYAANKWLFVR